MNITVFGAGYVGLVTAACFAEVGNRVMCVDIDADKVKRLKEGHCPIYEPGLEALLQKTITSSHLVFTTDVAEGVAHGTLQFIAVGTPPQEDGSVDRQHVLAVAKTIAQHMEGYKIIVNKSTVPVGTAALVKQTVQTVLGERGVAFDFAVTSNPEFLKEGAALKDFRSPDRIIIGSDNELAAEQMQALYAPFNRSHDRVICMDVRSAELTKYAANALLATKISFMNELSHVAETLGADIEQVRVGIGSDERIGHQFIYPGCGYGGSCFPKDVIGLISTAQQADCASDILTAVDNVNQRQKQVLFSKLSRYFNDQLEGKTIAVWGLAFKPNTDDLREASSRTLIEALWEAGAKVQAYDPIAMDNFQASYGRRADLLLCRTANEALKEADALVIVTEWNEFRSPDFGMIKQSLHSPVIIDGRNLYDPHFLAQQGFFYDSIGRPCIMPQTVKAKQAPATTEVA